MPGVVFEVRVLTLAGDPHPKPSGSCLLKLHRAGEWGLGTWTKAALWTACQVISRFHLSSLAI